MGPRNHVFDGVHIPQWEGAILRGRHSAVICAKTDEPIEMLLGFWAQVGPVNHVLDGNQDPPWKGAILGKGVPIVKYRDFLP